MLAVGLDWVPLEFHIWPDVHSGYVQCPSGSRLLDIMNYDSGGPADTANDFFEFIDITEASLKVVAKNAPEYVKKTTVDMIALTQGDLARGMGARTDLRCYPFRNKIPVPVTVKLQHHSLIGMAYRLGGEGIRDLLRVRRPFIPLTDVTITHDYGLWGSRPFVAVNKDHIISIKEESLANRRWPS